jgi:hypothetical protein
MEHFVADFLDTGLRMGNEYDSYREMAENELRKVGVSGFKYYTVTTHAAHDGGQTKQTQQLWNHTSLTGAHLKAILQHLDLGVFYKGPALDAMKLVWATFDRLMIALHSEVNSDKYLSPSAFRLQATQFARLFEFTMSTKFSPYMHSMTDHVPVFLELYGSLHQFSCQRLEHLHKIQKSFFKHHTLGHADPKGLRYIMEGENRLVAASLRYKLARVKREYIHHSRPVAPRYDSNTSWCLRVDTLATLEPTRVSETLRKLSEAIALYSEDKDMRMAALQKFVENLSSSHGVAAANSEAPQAKRARVGEL